MLEKPHLAILNRDEATSVATTHFSKQTALLKDLANYGSNLVIRAFDSSPKGMAEVIVCGVLLKQVAAMVDATDVLLSAGCCQAAFLPARTAFEASVYIDFMLSGDSELRATRYYVGNLRDQKVWAARATPGTVEALGFDPISKQLGIDLHARNPQLASVAATNTAEVVRILAQPNLASIDQEFDAARGKSKRDRDWYELDGFKSIRAVAQDVGRLPEYDVFYSRGSQVTHTGTYKDHVRFADGQVRFKPIRHLADVNMLLNAIVTVALGTYARVLKRYRPGEFIAFSRKYTEDWRGPFQNVQPVAYDF